MLMELDQVTYTYPCNRGPTITQLSLKIPAHQRCALIGRNGCGKTTLLRLLNGLYRPQQGQIYWQGAPLRYDRDSLHRLRQAVGLVFQDPEHQLVATTVAEDLSYGLCNLGLPLPEIADRVQQALAHFDLSALADMPVAYLSLGQKRRLAIADVMVLRPQLLLLDEPTAYLDPVQIRYLVTLLDQVHADGTTVMIATHNLEFAYHWADWIMVMDHGQIVLTGQPDTVFQHPLVGERLGVPWSVTVLDTIAAILGEHNGEHETMGGDVTAFAPRLLGGIAPHLQQSLDQIKQRLKAQWRQLPP
ncbi:energy-coupling factor ABC transporter ATP-binding protein [Trichothermofontia sp.]